MQVFIESPLYFLKKNNTKPLETGPSRIWASARKKLWMSAYFQFISLDYLGVVHIIKLNLKGLPQNRELIKWLVLAKSRDGMDDRVHVRQQLNLSSGVQFLPISLPLFHGISPSSGWPLSWRQNGHRSSWAYCCTSLWPERKKHPLP